MRRGRTQKRRTSVPFPAERLGALLEVEHPEIRGHPRAPWRLTHGTSNPNALAPATSQPFENTKPIVSRESPSGAGPRAETDGCSLNVDRVGHGAGGPLPRPLRVPCRPLT
jgi:hypothetical protein